MYPPPLLSCNLQNEDVMYVVVSAEALVLWRRHVRVGLHRMAELGGRLLAELKNRWPDTMQACSTRSSRRQKA